MDQTFICSNQRCHKFRVIRQMSDFAEHQGHKIHQIQVFKKQIEQNPKLISIINFENQMEIKIKTLQEFIINKLNSFLQLFKLNEQVEAAYKQLMNLEVDILASNSEGLNKLIELSYVGSQIDQQMQRFNEFDRKIKHLIEQFGNEKYDQKQKKIFPAENQKSISFVGKYTYAFEGQKLNFKVLARQNIDIEKINMQLKNSEKIMSLFLNFGFIKEASNMKENDFEKIEQALQKHAQCLEKIQLNFEFFLIQLSISCSQLLKLDKICSSLAKYQFINEFGLDIEGTQITDLEPLNDLLYLLPNLQFLELGFSALNTQSIDSLSSSFQQMTFLKHFEFHLAGVKIKSIEFIANAIKKMEDLEHFHLNLNATLVDDIDSLSLALINTKNLKTFVLYLAWAKILNVNQLVISIAQLELIEKFELELSNSTVPNQWKKYFDNKNKFLQVK